MIDSSFNFESAVRSSFVANKSVDIRFTVRPLVNLIFTLYVPSLRTLPVGTSALIVSITVLFFWSTMYQHLSTMHQQMVTFVKKYADFSGF
jgi:hypothetical protein